MRIFTPTALTTLAATALGYPRCDDKSGICLTSYRWCDASPGDYPAHAYPLNDDLGVSVGSAVLDESEDHVVLWTGAQPGVEVQVNWTLPWHLATNSGIVWQRNTTDDHVVILPSEFFRELTQGSYPELNPWMLRGLVAETNIVSIRQGDDSDTSSPFMV